MQQQQEQADTVAYACERHRHAHWAPYLSAAHSCHRPHSARGVYLSSRHTRSLTIHAALQRLGVLPPLPAAAHSSSSNNRPHSNSEQQQRQENSEKPACVRPWLPGEELRITIAGADHNEGTNAAESAVRFGELLRLCSQAGVQRVRLLLCGPGVSKTWQSETLVLPMDPGTEPHHHHHRHHHHHHHHGLTSHPSSSPAALSGVAANGLSLQQQQQQQKPAASPFAGLANEPLLPVTSVQCEPHPSAELSETSGDERTRAQRDTDEEAQDAEAGSHGMRMLQQFTRTWAAQQNAMLQPQRQRAEQQHVQLRRAASTQALMKDGGVVSRRRQMQAAQEQHDQAMQAAWQAQQERHAELRRAATTQALLSSSNKQKQALGQQQHEERQQGQRQEQLRRAASSLQAHTQAQALQRCNSSEAQTGARVSVGGGGAPAAGGGGADGGGNTGADGAGSSGGGGGSGLLGTATRSARPRRVLGERKPSLPHVPSITDLLLQRSSSSGEDAGALTRASSARSMHAANGDGGRDAGARAAARAARQAAKAARQQQQQQAMQQQQPTHQQQQQQQTQQQPKEQQLRQPAACMVVRVAYAHGRMHDSPEAHVGRLRQRQQELEKKRAGLLASLGGGQPVEGQQQQVEQQQQQQLIEWQLLLAKLERELADVAVQLGDLDTVERRPHLVACFNAGVWGYGFSWTQTLRYATHELQAPVVLTAYSTEEAEEDMETIELAGLGPHMLWGAEPNPFSSLRCWRWDEVPPARASLPAQRGAPSVLTAVPIKTWHIADASTRAGDGCDLPHAQQAHACVCGKGVCDGGQGAGVGAGKVSGGGGGDGGGECRGSKAGVSGSESVSSEAETLWNATDVACTDCGSSRSSSNGGRVGSGDERACGERVKDAHLKDARVEDARVKGECEEAIKGGGAESAPEGAQGQSVGLGGGQDVGASGGDEGIESDSESSSSSSSEGEPPLLHSNQVWMCMLPVAQ